MNNAQTKYIFITGGVVSSVGKGIIASSIGALLKSYNYKVFLRKFDPYLNVDPGTLNPAQHGEIFVTEDGAETDLDLGHYERFLNQNLNKSSNITSGKIFQEIIEMERLGKYMGKTIQFIPHVSDLIQKKFIHVNKKESYDFVITEIGGTVGDIELDIYLESIKQFKYRYGSKNVCNVHVTLISYLNIINEYKTKPAQNSLRALGTAGIIPDIIVARSSNNLPKNIIEKISFFSSLQKDKIFNVVDEKFKYLCPIKLDKLGIINQLFKYFEIRKELNNNEEILKWKEIYNKFKLANKKINIAIVGKYFTSKDAYISIYESINLASWNLGAKANIQLVNSNLLNSKNIEKKLKKFNGIIVPGGFGNTGIDGKILAIKYARINNVPFLGICLGFQLSVVEYFQNAIKLKNCHSIEFVEKIKNPIFIKFENDSKNIGGTLRLGASKCNLIDNSIIKEIYNSNVSNERYRHRFFFNKKYIKYIENDKNVMFSAINKTTNLPDAFEIKNNDFFVSVQFHPEYTNKPFNINPLFNQFIKKSLLTN